MKPIAIRELSRRAAVKVPMIRFYEEQGLIPTPGRTEGNRCTYGEADRPAPPLHPTRARSQLRSR